MNSDVKTISVKKLLTMTRITQMRNNSDTGFKEIMELKKIYCQI